MTYTNKQKATIFNQYAECNVLTSDGIGKIESIHNRRGIWVSSDDRHSRLYSFDECQLILTPLSEITDEDKKEISRICCYRGSDSMLVGVAVAIINAVFYRHGILHNYPNIPDIIDFLRLRGYCLDESLYTNGIAIKPNQI